MAVKKGVLTQGTNVWILHGTTPTLTKVSCVKALALGDDSPTEIDTTCLDETDSKTSDYGLNTPGEGSIQIDTDPNNASHITVLGLAEAREKVTVYVGWGDGTVEPTLAVDTVTLPTGRTWSTFDAILRENSPVFDADTLVNHTIGMKRQTKVTTTYKTPA